MGAILAIVAYELHTTTMQEHQDSVNSSQEGESSTPEINTNLIPSTRLLSFSLQVCKWAMYIQNWFPFMAQFPYTAQQNK